MIVLTWYVVDWRWQGCWLCWHYMWLTDDGRWWWLCWYYLWLTDDDSGWWLSWHYMWLTEDDRGDDCVGIICGWLKMIGGDDCVDIICGWLVMMRWWWLCWYCFVAEWWWQGVVIVLTLCVADWWWQGLWLCWHYLWGTGDDGVMMIVLIFFCGWVMMTGGSDCVDIMCGWLIMTGVMIVLISFVGDWWWWGDDDCVDICLWLSDDDRGLWLCWHYVWLTDDDRGDDCDVINCG